MRADEYPDYRLSNDEQTGKYAGVMEVGGLLCCKDTEDRASNVKLIIISKLDKDEAS